VRESKKSGDGSKEKQEQSISTKPTNTNHFQIFFFDSILSSAVNLSFTIALIWKSEKRKAAEDSCSKMESWLEWRATPPSSSGSLRRDQLLERSETLGYSRALSLSLGCRIGAR